MKGSGSEQKVLKDCSYSAYNTQVFYNQKNGYNYFGFEIWGIFGFKNSLLTDRGNGVSQSYLILFFEFLFSPLACLKFSESDKTHLFTY